VNSNPSEFETAAPESAESISALPDPKPRRGGSALALLALLIALGAAAGSTWIWWQGQLSGETEGDRLSSEISRLESNDSRLSSQLQDLGKALESLSAAGGSDRLEALQARLSEDRAQLRALQQTVQEQGALTASQQKAVDVMHGRLLATEAALAEVSGRELNARGELDLAEVDYLLRLASERLQLFSDRPSADRALVLADAHLAALDNPAYLGVRQAIAKARSELGAVDVPDDLAITGQLDDLQKAIPALPFPEASVPQAHAAPDAEQGWWAKFKATFASLVTVRRSTEEENRRISLQDQDIIRQRLWLQLDAAYLALMRHDQRAFGHALERARGSLADWFDPASTEVQGFQASLAELLALRVEVEWPDISAPWSMLQLVRSARGVPTPAPAPAASRQQPTPASVEPGPDGEPEPAKNIPDEDQ
jgi:uroporphyrin-3 C-methyltransferase